MATQEGPQLHNRFYSLCALPVTIFIYSTKQLHVQSRSVLLIPGHRIYSPQNSSYLSSYSIFRRNKVYKVMWVWLVINDA